MLAFSAFYCVRKPTANLRSPPRTACPGCIFTVAEQKLRVDAMGCDLPFISVAVNEWAAKMTNLGLAPEETVTFSFQTPRSGRMITEAGFDWFHWKIRFFSLLQLDFFYLDLRWRLTIKFGF